MSKGYNGHKNWNHWNVALWLHNEEPLYRRMCVLMASCKTRRIAAQLLLEELPERTPDGAPYSLTSIQAAMVGERVER